MFGNAAKKKLKEIYSTHDVTSGGIYKRSDENRELLEFLYEKSPEMLQEYPYVIGWIQSADEYLLAILHSMGEPLQRRHHPQYPRPFPTPPKKNASTIK